MIDYKDHHINPSKGNQIYGLIGVAGLITVIVVILILPFLIGVAAHG